MENVVVGKLQYLLVILYDVNAITVVDIKGTPVLVLQRGSNQQVSEAIVVEVWSGRQCVAKPGILGLILRLQSTVRHKHLLLGDKKEGTGCTGHLRSCYGNLTRV